MVLDVCMEKTKSTFILPLTQKLTQILDINFKAIGDKP